MSNQVEKKTDVVKVKVADLSGQALSWVAIQALGLRPVMSGNRVVYRSDHGSWVEPHFEWHAEAAELIESEWIGLMRPSKGQKTPLWQAITDAKNLKGDTGDLNRVCSEWGATSSLAVTRVFVTSHFGSTVDIPVALLPQSNPSLAELGDSGIDVTDSATRVDRPRSA